MTAQWDELVVESARKISEDNGLDMLSALLVMVIIGLQPGNPDLTQRFREAAGRVVPDWCDPSRL